MYLLSEYRSSGALENSHKAQGGWNCAAHPEEAYCKDCPQFSPTRFPILYFGFLGF